MYANMLTELGHGGQIKWHRRNILSAILMRFSSAERPR
jgi:hypothetical protein